MEFAIDKEFDLKGLFVEKMDIQTLVAPGPRGVTNFQMIPAMEDAIDNNDLRKLLLLNQNYPLVFASSFKYLTKPRKIKMETMLD